MPAQPNEVYNATLISGGTSTAIKTSQGVIGDVFFSSSTSGTVTIYDGLSATGTKIIDTFTGAAATKYEFRIGCATGIFIVTTGTLSATVLWV